MKIFKIFSIIFLIFTLFNCQRPFQLNGGASIVREGLIDCFKEGTKSGSYDLWCEASAVFYDGKRVYLANDKEMPGAESSVFYWLYNSDESKPAVTYLTNGKIKSSIKFEDFAMTPDRKYVFLTTAFDRTKPNSTDWDGYNSILYWKNTENITAINPQTIGQDNEPFSMSLRAKILKTLDNNNPYFKIEGLAVTDNKIYIGIREEGLKYDNFKYKTKIIAANYRIDNERISIDGEFSVLADIDVATLQPELPKNLGLSSIEYDPSRKIFWILTSYEGDNLLVGGYLWWATEADLKAKKLNLVRQPSGQPLQFTHKAEDLTLIGKRLFVIHDDDRHKTKVGEQTRQPHQTAYSMVELR
jgi:hypothetical protein